MIRLWHRLFGCGAHREDGAFFSRCKRCRRAWSFTSSGGRHELDAFKAAVLLDRTKPD